jgi:type III secretion protein T
MRTCVLIAAPVVIAMFLSEFGLALVSRFAPQLNVFILSMPIKSGVAIALLTVYCSFIIRFFSDELRNVGTLLDTLERIL